MTRSLTVLLGSARVGQVDRLNGGALRFTYDPSYEDRADATPVSAAMRFGHGPFEDPLVSNWLWGLLPDDDDLLKQWARRFQASLGSPFGLLEAPIGRDCAGAIRFHPDPEDGLDARPDDGIEWLDEAGVAAVLRALDRDRRAWLPRQVGGEFSLAGAQAKTALRLSDGRWGIPSGDEPTSHIFKPSILGFDDHDLNEHLCMDAAIRLGMPCARTEVMRFEDQGAIVITRYDRIEIDGSLVRVHQEDLCQSLGRHPRDKYQRDGGPTPFEIVTLLRRELPRRDVEDSVSRFVDALVWNWIIVGTDAHAKNYSLLLEGDQMRLAPLYDVGSILPYDGTHPRKWKFAMKYGGDYKVVTFANPWPKIAAELDVDAEALHERVLELCDTAADAMRDSVEALPAFARASTMPQRLLDAVAERAITCRRLVNGSAVRRAAPD
jgi:serine/threonine-protein kinase HipA